MSIFKSIWSAVTGFFAKELPLVEKAFTDTKTIVNVAKSFFGSATGQAIEGIIEALSPGLCPAIIAGLNDFFLAFGIVAAEADKSPAQVVADGLNAVSKLTDNNKAIALTNISAVVSHAIASGNGSGGISIQKALVAMPLVYNPGLLDDPSDEQTVENIQADTTITSSQEVG